MFFYLKKISLLLDFDDYQIITTLKRVSNMHFTKEKWPCEDTEQPTAAKEKGNIISKKSSLQQRRCI